MEQTDSCQSGGGLRDWMKEGEGVSQKAYIHNTNTDNSVVMARGSGGQVETDKGGKVGIERDFAWGDGHMIQCADDVLLSYTFETCLVLHTNVTPINSIF